MSQFQKDVISFLRLQYGKALAEADATEIYHSVSAAAMCQARKNWGRLEEGKKVCYFSAEFLVGRLVSGNLVNLGLADQTEELLRENGVDASVLEEIEDDALGNGGLGRLAACFLDSAATHGIAMNGYGIRYRYGLFRQSFENGFQKETADRWLRFGDPWSVRREDERVRVDFKGQSVWAVPYDYPVIGYGGRTVNTMRLWQAEPMEEFRFDLFNEQKYDKAYEERNRAEAISAVLYPNDDTDAGKRLRLKQQYFFSSASLRDLVKKYEGNYGGDFSHFSEEYAIQLNDTHPVVSIPELLRIFMEEKGMSFRQAFPIIRQTFAYTNHTVMAEALEKWSVKLFRSVIPQVYRYVMMLQRSLLKALEQKGITGQAQAPYLIMDGSLVHMARMAVYGSHAVNGVAQIHTEILKKSVLKEWYQLTPEKFQNKTNGITQRKWLLQCNPALSRFITERIGSGWITHLDQLKKMERFQNDPETLRRFGEIKRRNKQVLADYIEKVEGVTVSPDFLFDVQAKRLHEYKRQLLNAFSILDIYYGLKEGRIAGFTPTLFLFGAKAAPGYFRAKGIIKYISEIAKLIDGDPAVRGRMQVLFLTNYGVSYAEKLMPAAEISEQISTAGTEASGTSNMKFMLNGAVTLGTYDGANIEIVEQAGEDNNYIFGARIEEIEKIRESYDPVKLYQGNPRLRRAVDSLVDGTFSDGGTGMFRELYDALLKGASWHQPDHYFLLKDFDSYQETRLRANREYQNPELFYRKCYLNMANAGKFSSDRTIRQYYEEIWSNR